MMVTDLAMRDMSDRSDAAIERLCRWFASPFRHRAQPDASFGSIEPTMPAVEPSAITTSQAAEPIDFARHRSLSACRRALRLAAQHRFNEARSAFHTAIAADPRFDPADVSGFWDLPRRGMFAAIEAYEDHGRYHDAAALEIRILQTSRVAPETATSSTAVR